MGFCLFKEHENDGLFVAINPAYAQTEAHKGFTRLQFSADLYVDIDEDEKNVQSTLAQATKIGVQKLEVEIMAQRDNYKTTSLLLHQAQHIMMVREIPPETLPEDRPAAIMTMSAITHDNGRTQYIVERPGIFAMRANADGIVPGI